MSDRWQERAECARMEARGEIQPDDFFYEGRFQPNSQEMRQHVAALREICAECVVFGPCHEFVEETKTEEGFWAGETSSERRSRWYGVTPRPTPVVVDRTQRARRIAKL